MKQAFRQIGAVALLLAALCVFCRLTVARSYTVHIPVHGQEAERLLKDGAAIALTVDRPDVARAGKAEAHEGYLTVPVAPGRAGDAEISVFGPDGDTGIIHLVRVSRLGTVYDLQTAGFTGDFIVLIAVTLFWFSVSVIMLLHYIKARGPAYYAYSTIYFAGFFIFAAVTGLLMLRVTVAHILYPHEYSMLSAYGMINGAGTQFMLLTLPLIVVFAVSMLVSNAALLMHEKPRLQNVLGIVVSLLMLAGEAVGLVLFFRDFAGSERAWRIRNTLENVYATAFSYFECMLFGSVICGFTAARYQPGREMDYIIILGCWFRKDGSLPPLLKGRVDRALSFWRRQKEKTGREAVLIPSGGQGKDESMPEGEAIRRYLIGHDVPPECIRAETRALNTYQNMAYSREIIEEMEREKGRGQEDPKPRTVFATTNYHVFRSGVWAAQAGLPAEGIGGKTKWWFWPNAFMRECVGLLQRRWKQELISMTVLTAFFALLSMILG